MLQFWTALTTSVAENFPIILATLLSPLLAVGVTIWYQKRDQNHKLRLAVFTDLMKHRRRIVSPDFVNALNLVPVVFFDNQAITQNLRAVLDTVGSNDWTIKPDDPRFADVRSRLVQLLDTKTAVLLGSISRSLGIDVDQLTILQGAYHPQIWTDIENTDANIKTNLDMILSGRKQLPIAAMVFQPPVPDAPAQETASPSPATPTPAPSTDTANVVPMRETPSA